MPPRKDPPLGPNSVGLAIIVRGRITHTLTRSARPREEPPLVLHHVVPGVGNTLLAPRLSLPPATTLPAEGTVASSLDSTELGR